MVHVHTSHGHGVHLGHGLRFWFTHIKKCQPLFRQKHTFIFAGLHAHGRHS